MLAVQIWDLSSSLRNEEEKFSPYTLNPIKTWNYWNYWGGGKRLLSSEFGDTPIGSNSVLCDATFLWRSLLYPAASMSSRQRVHPEKLRFYASDLFLENADLPVTSTEGTRLKECSQFRYRLYSLSQSEAGISISIWGIKNTWQRSERQCDG